MKKTVAVAFPTSVEARRQISVSLAGIARVVHLQDPGFAEELPTAEILLLRGWRHELPEGAIREMRRLEFVQCLLAGVDHLPWSDIRPEAVICSNAGAQAEAVAEHAVAFLLAAAKRLTEHDAAIRDGFFRQEEKSKMIRGSTLGLLGYGHIGREIAKRARGLGMLTLGLNRRALGDEFLDEIIDPADLSRIAAESDFLVCLLPLTKATNGLIDAAFLGRMKEDAVLVNVSRGKVIDEAALHAHLRNHPRFTAALDVWWQYPKAEGERPYTQPFHELPNVLMTPHVASNVPTNSEHVLTLALENVSRYLRDEPLRNVVIPEDYR